GHQPAGASSRLPWRERVTSRQAWSDVAHNFRGDVEMLWKEIVAGFLIAGFISLLPMDFFNSLFITDASWPLRLAQNDALGPVRALGPVLCSVGAAPPA